jgi:hypothetical protein
VIKSVDPSSARELSMNEGETKVLKVVAEDVDSALTYTWSLDAKATDETSANFTYTPDFNAAGSHKVAVIVSDGVARAENTWNIKVTNMNRKPVMNITSPSDGTTFKSGSLISFTATATDQDSSDKLAYKWTSDGVDIGSTASFTKVLSAGTHKIRLEVNDGTETVSLEMTITVKKASQSAPTPGFEIVAILGAVLGTILILGRRKK